MKQREDFKQVLARAIYREIGARDFYRRIAEAIRNPEGSERFDRLSKDEEGHRAKLEGWYLKLFNAKFVAGRKELDGAEIKGVHVDDKTGAMEALDIAIDAEMKAEEFYSIEAAEVDDAELKRLLMQLSGEEHGHYELLLAERSSLAGNFYWFDLDSAQFLED
ncbi:MAG: ferritin family protein [Candidatus Krumholzibacteria bacterium]|nr:ferritin family protein [Candidatus Krumholzibacteria bacterium]